MPCSRHVATVSPCGIEPADGYRTAESSPRFSIRIPPGSYRSVGFPSPDAKIKLRPQVVLAGAGWQRSGVRWVRVRQKEFDPKPDVLLSWNVERENRRHRDQSS